MSNGAEQDASVRTMGLATFTRGREESAAAGKLPAR